MKIIRDFWVSLPVIISIFVKQKVTKNEMTIDGNSCAVSGDLGL